jgi:hypothetical protein
MLRLVTSLAFLISVQGAGAQDQPQPPFVPPPFVGGSVPPTDLPSGSATTAYMRTLSTPLARLFALARQVTYALRQQTK